MTLKATYIRNSVGTACVVCLLAACGSGCPYFNGERSTITPQFVVGVISQNNHDDLSARFAPITADDLDECLHGRGYADVVVYELGEWHGSDVRLPCNELRIASAVELREASSGNGPASAYAWTEPGPRQATCS